MSAAVPVSPSFSLFFHSIYLSGDALFLLIPPILTPSPSTLSPPLPSPPLQDVAGMTEEEQLALAMQMSMQGMEGLIEQPMETDGGTEVRTLVSHERLSC